MAPATSTSAPPQRGRRPARSAAEPILGASDAIGALADARAHTEALLAGLSDEHLERVYSPLMSPLVWDLGHIAAYEDLWLAHRHAGLALLRPDLAALYDAFETPRATRSAIPMLGPHAAREYMGEVRERTLQTIESHGVHSGRLHEMVIRHEHQHNETMLQTLALARLEGHRPGPWPSTEGLTTAPAAPSAGAGDGLELVDVTGGAVEIGAPAPGFAYDNERPAHRVELADFRIGRTPVTNGAWLEWMRHGGYRRREWWSTDGWACREAAGLEHPGDWERCAAHEPGFRQWHLGGHEPLSLADPVAHVCFFEAQAFARAHGARLPTELEWEHAATGDPAGARRPRPWGEETSCRGRANLREAGLARTAPAGALTGGAAACGALGLLGDVWEWTSSSFGGYPGFRAEPYREYSEVFFGGRYRVLRGGSWASSQRVACATFRNWDLPQRRQVFAGVRLAKDAR